MPNYKITEVRLRNWINAGRGQGLGNDYKPWIQISRQDFPSCGNSSVLVNPFSGRQHHLLSDVERAVFLQNLIHPNVSDIREQFPIWPWEHTAPLTELRSRLGQHSYPTPSIAAGSVEIARRIGFKHALYRGLDFPFIYTTDQLLTISWPGRPSTLLALAIKEYRTLKRGGISRTSKAGTTGDKRRRMFQKLRLEKSYWEAQGVPWLLVTDRQISQAVTSNVEWALSGALRRPNEHDLGAIKRLSWAWRQLPQGEPCTSMLETAAQIIGESRTDTIRLFKLSLLFNALPVDLTYPTHLLKPIQALRGGREHFGPTWSFLSKQVSV